MVPITNQNLNKKKLETESLFPVLLPILHSKIFLSWLSRLEKASKAAYLVLKLASLNSQLTPFVEKSGMLRLQCFVRF
jgi:hypothetical protein